MQSLYYPETNDTACLQVGVSLLGKYNRALLNYAVDVNNVIRRDSISPTLGILLSGSENKVCLHELPFLEPKFMVEEDGSAVSIETEQGDYSQNWTVCYEDGIRKVINKSNEALTIVILEPQRRRLLQSQSATS